ncbi:1-deoxy-D-xylulose-5-phosphate synthase [Nocardia inohanensis]|uniref:1-deoxy-D-xylulose-5-phosphate synthase n=1 Tax=Nocardia inohanensis TaxID=209246 RepID=UPI000AD0CE94|nr:1-deoxy-D-xylulose-5-phosphate synthase [Nocardia inohanensis]
MKTSVTSAAVSGPARVTAAGAPAAMPSGATAIVDEPIAAADLPGRAAGAFATAPADTGELPQPLRDVESPEALRALPAAQLPILAAQIRQLLLGTVLGVGGHLGPNLGVVELTIALHRVFRSPRDTLLFDTGHQAYVHKILTGRRAAFAASLRQPGGLSGYPSRAESVHDVIENSHASTALGYADGIAKARALQGKRDHAVVAVVGDGSLTGGMAYEALNNIGASHRPVVVVLNDNGHSYSPTAGAIAAHLADLRAGLSTSRTGPDAMGRNLFEHLGFTYLGPIDGHDCAALEAAFRRARRLGRPVVVHAVTIKGLGYEPAGLDPERMHTIGPARPAARGTASGTRSAPCGPPRPAESTWTDVFAEELVRIGAVRDDILAITAAMPGPTGLREFARRYPDRCYDVGIAEQHAVVSAAGSAMAGMHPVVAIYATFLNRAFDQVLCDVAMHRLPVTFVLDRAGITGPDGPSHHGMWDLDLLAGVPGMRIAAPRDATRLRELLAEAVADESGPTAVRYPKAAVGEDIPAVERCGGLDVLRRAEGREVLLVAVGPLAGSCLEAAGLLAASGIEATVVDPRWVLPIGVQLTRLCAEHRLVVTVEDGTRRGGVGPALAEALSDNGITTPMRWLGLPHRFLAHGERGALLAEAGLTTAEILRTVLRARAGMDGAATSEVSP